MSAPSPAGEGVEQLRDEVARLRALVLSLVDVLPVESLVAVGRAEARGLSPGAASEMFVGWVESTQLVPSEVATELRLLWQRCRRQP